MADGKPKDTKPKLNSRSPAADLKRYTVLIEGTERQIQLKRTKDGRCRVKLGNQKLDCELIPLSGPSFGSTKHILHLENRAIDLAISGGCREYFICKGGQEYQVQVEKSRIRELKKHVRKKPDRTTKGKQVLCEMPGLIVKLEVEKGQKVKRGQGLAVIDAMKMENEILAPRGGKITRIEVEEGQEVDKGHLICCIR